MLCFLDYYPLLPFDTQVCTVHLNPFDRIVQKQSIGIFSETATIMYRSVHLKATIMWGAKCFQFKPCNFSATLKRLKH